MAQLNLPHTLVAGTPENINDVQDNFQQIVDQFNNALVGDDNLTSPNNAVPRTVFSIGGNFLQGGTLAGTYVMTTTQLAAPSGGTCHHAPIWIQNSADFAVAGKTTQVRLVTYLVTNATAPGIDFTAGLTRVSAVSGASNASMIFTLAAPSATALFTALGTGTAYRVASSWVNLASLSTAGPYCLTVESSGTAAANSLVTLTSTVEMRHT